MIILKIVIILYLMHLLATSEHKGFIYPKFITSVKDLGAHFKAAKITNSLYFQPIDNKWRKKKCKSLGLKFKESILYNTNIERRKLTLSTFPYDLYKVEKLNSLYKSLAYVICGNEKLYAKIQRKVFVTIKNSKKFKKYMNGKLDLYLNGLDNVSKKDYTKYPNVYVELLAVALYLDVNIFLFSYKISNWILFDKNWPNMNKLSIKNEKSIYLYTDEKVGIIKNITLPNKPKFEKEKSQLYKRNKTQNINYYVY